jgi:hypothetical protein
MNHAMSARHPSVVFRPRSVIMRLAGVVAALLLVMLLAGCASGVDEPQVALPKGFPSSAVPIAAESVVKASASGSAWNVTVRVDGEGGQQAVLTKLKDAGFVVIGESGSTSEDQTYSLADSKWSVRLGFGQSADDYYTVTYGVSERAK